MNPVITIPAVFALICLPMCFDLRGSEPSNHSLPTNQAEVVIARMSVKTRSATFTLLDLHRKAVERLSSKYEDFREFVNKSDEQGMLPSVHFEVDRQKGVVELRYGGGIGARIWCVIFSEAGKISAEWSGSGVDHVPEIRLKNRGGKGNGGAQF